jgi:hypothetical protein
MPIILGLIVDIIVRIISDLPPAWRVLIVVTLGVIYLVFDLARRRPKQVTVSRRAANLMTIALVVAIILVGAASLILGLTVASIVFLIGWLILMIVFIRFAQSLPAISVVPQSVLRGVAAVSLGAALSIGGGTVADLAIRGPVQLTIHNYCPTPLVYEPLGIEVAAYGSQTIEVLPVTVIVRREESRIFVRAFGLELPFVLPENVDVSFDGRLIEPRAPLRVNLREREAHELIITCR